MKILVTGAAGFIGFHVCQKLLARGDQIIGVDNLNDYYDVSLKMARLSELGVTLDAETMTADHSSRDSTSSANFEFIKLDIADRAAMESLFAEHQFDAVCHLAAQAGVRYSIENPHVYVETNVVGFLNILEGCRQHNVDNLCFASSSSVYGLNQSQPFKTSDHTDHPVSLYAATKKSNEMMAHTYAHLFGIRCTGLRFFTVYGPWGRPDMAPMLFADAISNNRPIKVFNHGDMSRDFTYVGDIAEGILAILDTPAGSKDVGAPTFDPRHPSPETSSAPYRLYNIGNNSPVNLMAFIRTLEAEFGTEAQKIMMDMQPGDVASTYADSSSLTQLTGFTPNTELAEGIKHFANWYRGYFKK
ncbi:NAD-dependent epimerase [Psychrobacter sp. YP14]|uniref:NAD-dependent epimerase n=1 Tax=Psychrobacter sp. YP14 TaxID=2203895 RepID=UPI000D7DF8BD|nr:NAD-dependent epimerase [Psychrobacter sp. YP14]AWT48945.1 NAD-dependent epimerase [Psychrobacter sp. YP14]